MDYTLRRPKSVNWQKRVPPALKEDDEKRAAYIRSRVIATHIGDDRRFPGVALQAAFTENA